MASWSSGMMDPGALGTGLPDTAAMAMFAAVLGRHSTRAEMLSFIASQSLIGLNPARWRSSAPTGRGRGGTVGPGTRPGAQGPRPQQNFWASKWGKMLNHPHISDPRTKTANLFRLRFRVPHPVYLQLLEDARENFPYAPDAVGHMGMPLECRILGWLRILGRGWCFDDVSEMSELSQSGVHVFFHQMNEWVVKKYKTTHLSPPDDEEAARSEKMFSHLGFPGCVAQSDGVHVAWPMCPHGVRPMFVGQKGYCTMNFNVTVGLTRKIYHVTDGFPGVNPQLQTLNSSPRPQTLKPEP